MTHSRAILDFIGLPVHVPGNLECRIRRIHYDKNGNVIDDGSRSTEKQLNCHRFVLSPNDNIDEIVDQQVIKGYEKLDSALIKQVADFAWDKNVLEYNKSNMNPEIAEPRMIIRALGFAVDGSSEIAVGVGTAIYGPEEPKLISKQQIMLSNPEYIMNVIQALDMYADQQGLVRINDMQVKLIMHVASTVLKLTNDNINNKNIKGTINDAILFNH